MVSKILIIEDREEVAKLWEAFLKPLGGDICIADSFAEGLSMMRQGPCPNPDLVLLDLGLADSPDPKRTISRIGELKEINPQVVVVVISGLLTPELGRMAIDAGAMEARIKIEVTSQRSMWQTIQSALQRAISSTDKKPHEAIFDLVEDLNNRILQQTIAMQQ
jgi:DNA-binding response OmpR family regulator